MKAHLPTRFFSVWLPLLVAVGTLSIPMVAFGDSLGDYKNEKHDGGSSSSDGDDDEDGTSVGEAIGDILTGLSNADSEDDYESPAASTSSSHRKSRTHTSVPQACHFERYYGCMNECEQSPETCRERCRRDAQWLCGTRATAHHTRDMTARNGTGWGAPEPIATDAPRFQGMFEMGIGAVEGGSMVTAEHRFRSGHFGAGAHVSYMWNREHRLVETDVGPAAFIPASRFQFGLQPSLLLSLGNDVETEAGTGLRLHADYLGTKLLLSFGPMGGVINGKFNLHTRTSVGYRFSEHIYGKIGHDFRHVRDLSSASESSMHGGFLNVGFQFQ